MNELEQEGFSPDPGLEAPVKSDDSVICVVDAEDGNEPVGVLCYRLQDGLVKISLFYVEPSSRRAGVARMLINDLRTRHPSVPLELAVATANLTAIKVAARLSLQPRMAIYRG